MIAAQLADLIGPEQVTADTEACVRDAMVHAGLIN